MQTSYLQAFISVAESGSFSRAAEELFLTQSAISKRIATLELELERKLFDRIGHQITLTEAGKTLLPRARHILAQVEDSRREIQNLSGEVSGTLSLGTSHHIGLHRLPPTLQQFNNRYPSVELDLHFMESEAVCSAISHGDLEIGIITLPEQAPSNLTMIELWQDPLCFVCGHGHPLANQKTLTLQQLISHPAILPTRESATHQILVDRLAPYAASLTTKMNTNNLETIKMMVSINLGWSLLPETLLDKNIKKLEVNNFKLSRKLGVITNRERTLSNAAKQMIALLTMQASVTPIQTT